MEKLYKLTVLFVGLIAMTLSVKAQLGGYSSYLITDANASGKSIATSYFYTNGGDQLDKVTNWASLNGMLMVRGAINFTNYPNPATTQTTVEYTLTANANVTLRVIDLAGKQLAMLLKQQPQTIGKQGYVWEFAKNNITSGMYILILQVDNKTYSRKIIVQ